MNVSYLFLILVQFLTLTVVEVKCENLLKLVQIYLNELNDTVQNNEISEECRTQLFRYMTGLRSFELWSWQMFDASSKIPTGILAGNFFDLGNFDECLNVTGEVSGKYCLGTIPLTMPSRALGNNEQLIGFHLALCIPAKCTAQDASKLLPFNNFTEKYCYTDDTRPQLDPGSVATISVLSAFLLLAAISTLCDIFMSDAGFLVKAFSFYSNGRKLLTFTKNPQHLTCLDGMKSLSMIWIIIAHEYTNGSSAAVANYFEIVEFRKRTENMFVIGATVAVDTFFVVGGLVTVYTFLRAQVKFNILLYYVHRYIRLTPALAVVVAIHITLLKHLGYGPLWNTFDDHLVKSCQDHWWAALLYIQNFVHNQEACVPQTWYLSIDMQLFILSPLVLIPLKRKPKLGVIALILLSLAGVAIPFVIAYHYELRGFLIDDNQSNVQNYMFFYYEQTHCRFGAYVIGMVLGYIVVQMKNGTITITLKKYVAVLLWICSLSVLVACVYAGHDLMLADYNKLGHSLYIAFNRPAWALAVSVMIFLCVSGYGGAINAFLSAEVFQLISKLSYSIYLVHYALILVRAASYKTEITVSHFLTFFNFWGDFVFSLALAAILCLSFESPMIALEKRLFSKR